MFPKFPKNKMKKIKKKKEQKKKYFSPLSLRKKKELNSMLTKYMRKIHCRFLYNKSYYYNRLKRQTVLFNKFSKKSTRRILISSHFKIIRSYKKTLIFEKRRIFLAFFNVHLEEMQDYTFNYREFFGSDEDNKI